MISSYPFSELPGFSALFCDEIAAQSTVMLQDIKSYSQRKLSPFSRQNSSIIRNTMSGVEMSELQLKNLALLETGNACVVITGQQVGFLGGPLYSIHKALSCIQYAMRMSSNDCIVIPIFWIEDNDHDSKEAGTASIIDQKGAIREFSCFEENDHNHIPVGELVFSESVNNVLDAIRECLPDTEFGNEAMNHLKNIYKPGVSWTSAFVAYMHNRLKEFGILFYSANEARKQGVFEKSILRELQNPGLLKQLVEQSNAELKEKGYSKQAEASEFNLFLHDATNYRYKIHSNPNGKSYCTINDEQKSIDELIVILNNNPSVYSPSVLLRPLIQDEILPTVAMVVGPGEMAYMKQLSYVYKTYNLPVIPLLPRHSFTLLPPSILRFLEKYSLKPIDFMKIYNEVEKDLTEKFAGDNEGDALLMEVQSQLLKQFEEIDTYAQTIDKSLSGTIAAGKHAIEKQIEIILKKIQSARKRNNEALFGKTHEVASWIYPANQLQERVLSPISCEVKIGMSNCIDVLMQACKEQADKHYLLPLMKGE